MQGTEPTFVHVHPGSILLDHLAAAQLPGERLEWCDPVADGPTPAGLSDAAWVEVRAEYLRGLVGTASSTPFAARLRAQDAALRALPQSAEIVIWVGPELFCQAALMRLLTLLAPLGHALVSLVDPGDDPRFPGCCLGHLDAAELTAAFEARRPLSRQAFSLAARAWAAFTAPNEAALQTFLAGDVSALPHLGPALERHLADLPSASTGLSTTETHLLECLEEAPMAATALLAAIARREPRPWLTDTMLAQVLERLASTSRPLVTATPEGIWMPTPRAQAVLAGADAWSATRWLGGILIEGDEG